MRPPGLPSAVPNSVGKYLKTSGTSSNAPRTSSTFWQPSRSGNCWSANTDRAVQVIENVQQSLPGGPERSWLQQEWQQFLDGTERDGWRLGHIQFRQRAFDPAQGAQPESSRFSFRADVAKTNGVERATIEGDITVKWTTNVLGTQPAVAHIDARQLSIRSRTGESAFHEVLNETIQPPEKSLFIDPLILYNLDGDGISEIILAGKNLVYHRQPDGQYQSGPLCKYDPDGFLRR